MNVLRVGDQSALGIERNREERKGRDPGQNAGSQSTWQRSVSRKVCLLDEGKERRQGEKSDSGFLANANARLAGAGSISCTIAVSEVF